LRRPEPEPARSPAEDGAAEPAAAPADPGRAPRGVSPLPHVTVHVVQAQLVRLVRTDLGGSPEGVAEVSLSRGELVGGLLEGEVERALLLRVRSAPAGVFPLLLRRQAIHPATIGFPGVELAQELLGIIPRHTLHRKPFEIGIGDLLDPVLTASGAGEVAGVA